MYRASSSLKIYIEAFLYREGKGQNCWYERSKLLLPMPFRQEERRI